VKSEERGKKREERGERRVEGAARTFEEAVTVCLGDVVALGGTLVP